MAARATLAHPAQLRRRESLALAVATHPGGQLSHQWRFGALEYCPAGHIHCAEKGGQRQRLQKVSASCPATRQQAVLTASPLSTRANPGPLQLLHLHIPCSTCRALGCTNQVERCCQLHKCGRWYRPASSRSSCSEMQKSVTASQHCFANNEQYIRPEEQYKAFFARCAQRDKGGGKHS